MLMTRTPNIEGSDNHQEAIARYTHNPPAIRDGSLGFGSNYEAKMNNNGVPEMVDGKFREFSTVNFPGGYDRGGVNAAFADAIEKRKGETEVNEQNTSSGSAFSSKTVLISAADDADAECGTFDEEPDETTADNGSENSAARRFHSNQIQI